MGALRLSSERFPLAQGLPSDLRVPCTVWRGLQMPASHLMGMHCCQVTTARCESPDNSFAVQMGGMGAMPQWRAPLLGQVAL